MWYSFYDTLRVSNLRKFVGDSEEKETNERTERITIPISKQSVEISMYYTSNLFLPYALKLMRYVQSHADQNEIRRLYDLAVKHADSDGKIQHSKLLRFANRNAREVKRCVGTLIEADLLESVDVDGATYYRPLDAEEDAEFPEVEPPTDVTFDLPTPELT